MATMSSRSSWRSASAKTFEIRSSDRPSVYTFKLLPVKTSDNRESHPEGKSMTSDFGPLFIQCAASPDPKGNECSTTAYHQSQSCLPISESHQFSVEICKYFFDVSWLYQFPPTPMYWFIQYWILQYIGGKVKNFSRIKILRNIPYLLRKIGAPQKSVGNSKDANQDIREIGRPMMATSISPSPLGNAQFWKKIRVSTTCN